MIRLARISFTIAVTVALVTGAAACAGSAVYPDPPAPPSTVGAPLPLPAPDTTAETSLTTLIDSRHSVRSFADTPLSQANLAALLWAAYGYRTDGGRTIPSAGGLYALTMFVAVGNVEGIPPGTYAWDPAANNLGLMAEGDPRATLQRAALDQESVGTAPVTIVIAGSATRLEKKYGPRAEQFTLNEAGHAAQNTLLMATALDLGAVPVGGFREDEVASALILPKGETPYYLIPVGIPAG